MPVGRLLMSASLLAGVVAIPLAVFVLAGRMPLVPALLTGGIVIGGQWIALRSLFVGSNQIRRGLAQLTEDPEGASPAILTASAAAIELWFAIMRLVRQFRQLLRQARQDIKASEAVLAALPDPMILLGQRREILRVNQAAVEWFGDTLIGRDVSAAMRNPSVLAAVDAVRSGEPHRVVDFELTVPFERSLRARIERLGEHEPRIMINLSDLTTLKRAEQLRADFVANASHELRTPLSTIIGFVETLEGPAADDPDARKRFLPIMRQQATRMARLVDDLLSLSRIELNEHLPPRDEVDLARLVRGVAQSLELKAAGRGIKIDIELPDALAARRLAVRGDADELTQVFQNLIDNAIKYGGEGKPVRVTAGESGKFRRGIFIAVRDEGEGIARRHLPRLTERFYRVDSARSRAMGGTGLGLAIVKHIVSRHRGALEIDSAVGVGSVFTVHLPLLYQPIEGAPKAAEPVDEPRLNQGAF